MNGSTIDVDVVNGEICYRLNGGAWSSVSTPLRAGDYVFFQASNGSTILLTYDGGSPVTLSTVNGYGLKVGAGKKLELQSSTDSLQTVCVGHITISDGGRTARPKGGRESHVFDVDGLHS